MRREWWTRQSPGTRDPPVGDGDSNNDQTNGDQERHPGRQGTVCWAIGAHGTQDALQEAAVRPLLPLPTPAEGGGAWPSESPPAIRLRAELGS